MTAVIQEIHLPTVAEIEAERVREGISVRELCKVATIEEATYYRGKGGYHKTRRDIRKKLAAALVQIKQADAIDIGTRAA